MISNTTAGWDTPLSPYDFAYILLNSPDPARPQRSSSGGISAGGVLLIVFFCLCFAYFGTGMALNFKRTGSPTVPHAAFWSQLPTLVAEGVVFSCCQCFGLRGGRQDSYSSLDTDTKGYGSL